MASPSFVGLPRKMLPVTIDGQEVQAMEGTTILDACRRVGVDTPTLCT
ncbi:MAG: 2Fe-2S iron-sulfur cluster binding domain-containing protein, partial [Chloroflexi bacterium]